MSYVKPVLTVEYAPGFSARNRPGPGDWVTLGKLRSYSIREGKQDEQNQHEPGTCVLVIDNGKNDLDQSLPKALGSAAWSSVTAYTTVDGVVYGGKSYNCIANNTNQNPKTSPAFWVRSSPIGQLRAWTPVRVRATIGATTRTRFTGYTRTGWKPEGRKAHTVTVTLVDFLGWGARCTLPTNRWASWVTREQPNVWYRGEQNNVTGDVHNMARRWTSPYGGDLSVNLAAYPNSRIESLPSIVSGDADGRSINEGAYPFGTGWGSLKMGVPDLIPASGAWFVAFWMQSTAKGGQYYGTTGAGDIWWIGTDASGFVNLNVKASGTLHSCTIAVDHCDGNPHLIMARVLSTGGFRIGTVGSDLGSATMGITANIVTGGGIIELNGADLSTVDDFVYFDHHPVMQDGTTNMTLSTAASEWMGQTDELGKNEDTTERLDALGAYGLVDMPDYEITLGSSAGFDEYVPAANLTEGIQNVARSFLGDAFMTREGKLRVRDSTFTSATADDYTTVHAQITDEDGATAPPVVLRCETRGRTPGRPERVINQVSLTGHTARVFIFDLASQLEFGLEAREYDTGLLFGDFDGMAQAVLDAYSQPIDEIDDLTVRPWGNQDATDFFFLTLELEHAVDYVELTPDGTSAVIDSTHRVIGISEDWTNGTDWTVTLHIAPA